MSEDITLQRDMSLQNKPLTCISVTCNKINVMN